MNKVCREYLRQVRKSLRCTYKERKQLLSGLETELEDAFLSEPGLAAADLTARFGTPEAVAEELMAALPEGTAGKYETARRKKWMAAAAACLVVIAMLVGYLAWLGSIDVDVSKTEEHITYETHYIIEEDNP